MLDGDIREWKQSATQPDSSLVNIEAAEFDRGGVNAAGD